VFVYMCVGGGRMCVGGCVCVGARVWVCVEMHGYIDRWTGRLIDSDLEDIDMMDINVVHTLSLSYPQVYIRKYMSIYIYVCMYAYAYIYIFVCEDMCVCTYVNMYIYIYIYMYIYVYVYGCV